MPTNLGENDGNGKAGTSRMAPARYPTRHGIHGPEVTWVDTTDRRRSPFRSGDIDFDKGRAHLSVRATNHVLSCQTRFWCCLKQYRSSVTQFFW